MRYAIMWQGNCVQVELHEISADGRVTCTIDGREVICHLSGSHAHDVGVTLDEQQFWAQIDGDTVWLGEHRLRAEVVDLRTLALRRAQEAVQQVGGRQEVISPMPGRVAALLVRPGQQVAQGEPIMVVEAMKMENELRAPKAGVVEDIAVQVGATVEMGAVLCFVA